MRFRIDFPFIRSFTSLPTATGNASERRDPLPMFTFAVEINGITNAFFRSVGGLSVETEVSDYPEGGFNHGMRKMIGRSKSPNIILKKGFCGPPYTLWDFHAHLQSETEAVDRFDGTIYQLGPDMQRICAWKFHQGFVCKWVGPELDASKSELAIETIEIAHEGLELIKVTR